MRLTHALIAPLMMLAAMTACSGTSSAENNSNTMTDSVKTENNDALVKVHTTAGDFTVRLYGDTPRHRDNFLRLAREHYYDSTLFHRVIKNFMIQAGDPDSRTAAPGHRLGAGGPEYKIDAEIVFPKHFHKRGALAAARQGDQVNPMRQSSGSQFYIVTGKVIDSTQMTQIERHMTGAARQRTFAELVNARRQEIMAMQQAGNQEALENLRQQLIAETERLVAQNPPVMTPEMKQAYSTVGGAPHLDGDYTVFGEVTDGMDTVDRIEAAETGPADRPRQDIRILSMEVL